jgi:hypothetical protein
VVVGGNGITRTLLLKLIKKHLSHSQHYHVSLKAFFSSLEQGAMALHGFAFSDKRHLSV